MPTTLPSRSFDSTYGPHVRLARRRFRSLVAVSLIWAGTMIALSTPLHIDSAAASVLFADGLQ